MKTSVLSVALIVVGLSFTAWSSATLQVRTHEMLDESLAAIGAVRAMPPDDVPAYLDDLTDRVDAHRAITRQWRLMRWLALVLAAAGAVLAWWSAQRDRRAATEADRLRATADKSSRRGLEELLKRRLEELYSTRFRAWESERFAAYGELAAGLSHGLKTPLATVRAAAQLAQKKLDDEHPAHAQLDDIIDEVDQLVDQIQRFLRSTGEGAPVPARLSASDLVDALNESYAAQAREQGVVWETEAAECDAIQVDPALVEMALRNIVENALAAAPAGTSVRVTSGPGAPPERAGLEMKPPADGSWVEIAIADQGAGIPREVLSAREVSSSKTGGSGLGLAIARRVVARHGGALAIDTPSQGGTIVRVLLPAAPERTA